jgi:hypothetical protein
MNSEYVGEWKNIPENAFLYFPTGDSENIQGKKSSLGAKRNSGGRYSKEDRPTIPSKPMPSKS